jgi:hypothetical protein
MIVTFRPTINNTSDYTACYLNFLRCVTAIATASAGTTSLTVNPYTASNTIDTSTNCIRSIDANTEAGGWTTSASHNVPSSGNNTPAAYTALASAAAFLYKADFYNASTKATYPYKKLCFHSYNDNTDTQGNNWATNYNPSYGSITQKYTRSAITATRFNNVLITFGCSSTTDWTDTKFPPGTGTAAGYINDVATQRTSWTLNEFAHWNMDNQYRGNKFTLNYTDTTVEYHMAVTADYCVIWESKIVDTYAAGYFTTATNGNGDGGGAFRTDGGRFGSIFYMGLRETQAWENSQPDNVPWVCWHYLADTEGNGSVYNGMFPQNNVSAFMNTINNSMIVQTPAKIYRSVNKDYTYNVFFSTVQDRALTAYSTSYNVGYQAYIKELDTPLFVTKRMSNTTTNTGNNLYTPVYDAVTGLQVPPAYPIKISRNYNGDFNSGGACRGIYKSLSMPYATIKQVWQAGNQTFTIGTDTYLPFCLDTDMWLVRFA